MAKPATNKALIKEIRGLIAQGQQNAVHAVDFQRVSLYWHIGKRIFEEEQQGKAHTGLSFQLRPNML